MNLTRKIWIQLAVFATVALIAGAVMLFGYVKAPALLFGIGRYTVTLELPAAAGLYKSGNVSYRGTKVGRVDQVRLTDTGVEAILALESGIDIPSDLEAEVHSQSAIGEQFVSLIPRDGSSVPLKDGDVIPSSRTTVPPDINELLDATNSGLEAIPQDNLKTVIDESYTAFGGLGPEMGRIIKGSTALAIESRKNLDHLTNLIDNVAPVLDTQTETADSVRAWAQRLGTITESLQRNDAGVQGVLQNGAAAGDEARVLFERLKPTLPVLLTDLVSLNRVAVAYRENIEQLLVLVPVVVADLQGIHLANRDTKQHYQGAYLSFNLNLNLPPACTTGFLPANQQRSMSEVDYPPRPAGDVYCRIPQDSEFNVRGARNTPCATRPGKRAPTAKMCESDEEYLPLNDGFNWKGDPNATLTGQPVPQLPPGVQRPVEPAAAAQPTPPLAVVPYDPETGTYVGPDGQVYTQSNLGNAEPPQTWQAMLAPPGR